MLCNLHKLYTLAVFSLLSLWQCFGVKLCQTIIPYNLIFRHVYRLSLIVNR